MLKLFQSFIENCWSWISCDWEHQHEIWFRAIAVLLLMNASDTNNDCKCYCLRLKCYCLRLQVLLLKIASAATNDWKCYKMKCKCYQLNWALNLLPLNQIMRIDCQIEQIDQNLLPPSVNLMPWIVRSSTIFKIYVRWVKKMKKSAENEKNPKKRKF